MPVQTVFRTALIGVISVSALSLGACGTFKQGIGLSKVVPDEFVTVATAPLSVPPEFGLRPPAPGQPRPQELAPESAARQILLGERQAITRTPGETALVNAAGADRADPLARYVVDDEFGDLAHKEESFADRVLFWRRDSAPTQAPTVSQTAAGAVTIDATTEASRLQALTGGQQAIVIQPRRASRFKLPGL